MTPDKLSALDWSRLRAWAESCPRQPAAAAFTAGVLRDAASAVEGALEASDALAARLAKFVRTVGFDPETCGDDCMTAPLPPFGHNSAGETVHVFRRLAAFTVKPPIEPEEAPNDGR